MITRRHPVARLFGTIRRPWFYGVLLAAGSVLLFVGGPDDDASRSLTHFWNIGHIVYFALLADLLTRWQPVASRPPLSQWAVVVVVTLLLGVLIECLQYGTTRTPDAADVLRDLTGSLLVLVFGLPGSAIQPAAWRRVLQTVMLALLLGYLWPLSRALTDEAIARRQFPVLSDFETPFELNRWEGDAALSVESVASIAPGRVLKVSLTRDRYSGAGLRYFESDWTSFGRLQFSIYNPDADPLSMVCRINDRRHAEARGDYDDRFNRNLRLTHGWNHIEIDLDEVRKSPAHRSMDMSRIHALRFFTVSLPAPRTVYLDDVRLLP
jgi:VanZ family protein